jgi:hypothetical protein
MKIQAEQKNSETLEEQKKQEKQENSEKLQEFYLKTVLHFNFSKVILRKQQHMYIKQNQQACNDP